MLTLKGKIALGVLGAAVLIAGFVVYQWKEGQFAKIEKESAEAYAKQLTEQVEWYQKEQEKLNKETEERIQKLLKTNADLEKQWSAANKEKTAAVKKYQNLVNKGYKLGDKGGKFTAETTMYLVEFATEADLVVSQLRACQHYAKSLRESCESKK